MGDREGYNHPRYYPIWEFCQQHNMVVHTHSGPSPDYDYDLPGAIGIFLNEFAWWASRPMWFMIFGGVFEKFPHLRFALTEVSEFWVPHMLEMMDVRASVKHTTGKLGDFRSNLTMTPSEYFRRNCWIGASALFDEGSTAVRHNIGIDRVMWGTDYPHPEGSWPKTHEKLVTYMKGLPEVEIEAMLGDGGQMEIMRDWGAKLAGATLRLAAVLHCVEHEPAGLIALPTIVAAVNVARYLIPHAEVVLNMMSASDDSADDDAR